MVRDIAAYLRGEAGSLPGSILDAMEPGIAALAIDQARTEGRIVDVGETTARLDAFGLRR